MQFYYHTRVNVTFRVHLSSLLVFLLRDRYFRKNTPSALLALRINIQLLTVYLSLNF